MRSSSTSFRYQRDPSLFRAEVSAQPRSRWIVLDEVQRVPGLLDEVHYLMEEKDHKRFALTGSSARKLKSGAANLLAGRARHQEYMLYVYVAIVMKRTTLYLDADTEVLLKLESMRRRQPMAEIVREALQAYLRAEPRSQPPGRGAFRSGRKDVAERAEELLSGAFGTNE